MAKKKLLGLRALGFRPSTFPRLELCIHYQAKPGEESEAAGRGQDLHEQLAAVLAGELNPQDIKDPEARSESRRNPDSSWLALA